MESVEGRSQNPTLLIRCGRGVVQYECSGNGAVVCVDGVTFEVLP